MPSGRRLCAASSSVASVVAGGGNAGDLARVVPQRWPQEKVRHKKCTADVGWLENAKVFWIIPQISRMAM